MVVVAQTEETSGALRSYQEYGFGPARSPSRSSSSSLAAAVWVHWVQSQVFLGDAPAMHMVHKSADAHVIKNAS